MTRPNRLMKRGEVLHVTKYGTRSCDCWVVITEEAPLWEAVGGQFICGALPPNRSNVGRACSIDVEDEFRVVAASRAPQRVVTELARLTLMGEIGE